MIISPVSLCVRLKFLFLEHFRTRHFYCLLFSLFCFRLNSNIRNNTGTHVFWENGVDYPRVSPGAHPLVKKPEDSGYEIGICHKIVRKSTNNSRGTTADVRIAACWQPRFVDKKLPQNLLTECFFGTRTVHVTSDSTVFPTR